MTVSIHAAFAAAYQQVENVKKNATNPAFKSGYATLDVVLEAVKPALEAQNLVLVQNSVSTEWGAGVHTKVRDETGAEIDFDALILPYQKRDPQGAGSCLSYARRYALKSIFGLAEVDDDGQDASKKPKVPTFEEVMAAAGDKHKAAVGTSLGDPENVKAAKTAFAKLSDTEKKALMLVAKGELESIRQQ